jgi:hypothetical protein
MTLAATETIDLVMLTRDRGTIKLVVVATEDLSGDGPAVEQLRAKLAHHREAIRSGRFNELFPQYAALAKMIQIDHYTPLGPRAEEVLAGCAKELHSDGVRLVSNECSFNPVRILASVFRRRPMREWQG